MGLMLYEGRHWRIHRSRPRYITTIIDNNSQYSVVSLQQVYSCPIIMPKNAHFAHPPAPSRPDSAGPGLGLRPAPLFVLLLLAVRALMGTGGSSGTSRDRRFRTGSSRSEKRFTTGSAMEADLPKESSSLGASPGSVQLEREIRRISGSSSRF